MKSTTLALCAGLLIATLGSTPAAQQTVTLTGTNLSFSQMHAACNDGLGGITFANGHVRFIGSNGVGAGSDLSSTGVETISFNGASGTATAVANGHTRSVTAKHIQVRQRRSIACIFPD